MHKIPWNSEIQTYHTINAKQPDLALMNKKKRTCHPMDFSFQHTVKMEEEIWILPES